MTRTALYLLAAAFGAAHLAVAQVDGGVEDSYKPLLYWSVYEYHILRQQAEVIEEENWIPETELVANIDWVEANLKPYGYETIAIDGWGDVLRLSENGYAAAHSSHWQHDYAYWADYLAQRGMRLGMYGNPLWIHVEPDNTETKIVGTDLNVSSLIDPQEDAEFRWVQVDRPGAEEYVKGYVRYYADMGVRYFRLDFLSWFENGQDRYLGRVGPDRPREHYETALRWIREAADESGMYLSFAMVHLHDEAAIERRTAHAIRVSEDTDYGEWWKFSSKDRGIRVGEWSQYANVFDGFVYWSYLSERNDVRLDGDFIRINTFATPSEKRTVISAHLVAGGPLGVADRHDSIGDDLWLYQNEEILALNEDAFVGEPLVNDPEDEASQVWTGTTSNGDGIVAFFNRESEPRTRSISFGELGFSGEVAVRDLWQRNDLGNMSSIAVELAPHASMVMRLRPQPTNCVAQSILFEPIADINYGQDAFSALTATATSGLPVEFEVALGPAAVQNGNEVAPTTGQGAIVYVLAKQPGDAASCAAIPQIQSFAILGGHEPAMYVAGTFTNWQPSIAMRLVEDWWIAEEVQIPAGLHEFKFLNTEDFTGKDWGNAQGFAGTAAETTGGGVNVTIDVPADAFYRFRFNDLTLEYSLEQVNPGRF